MKPCIPTFALAAVLVLPWTANGADSAAVTNSPTAARSAGESIVFLHLRRGPEGVTLLGRSVRHGHLKAQPANGTFEFEVVDADGAVLQSGAMRDPAVRRLEYEDPLHPGQLLAREVNAGTAEFTVRITGNSAARAVRFYLKNRPAQGELTAQAAREFLGEVALSSKAETP